MDIVNFLLCSLLIIHYNLALTYIGVTKILKDTLIPSLILTVVAFISKIVFIAPPVIHTIILVLTISLLISFFNKIDLILSAIGALLSIMTSTFGSLLIAWPLVIYLGFGMPKQNEVIGLQWTIFALMEYIIPFLVLIILKTTKASIGKYINQR